VKRGHVVCAALLNPSSAEPLVWPSALKFISEVEPNAKALLEAALMDANRERERRILKGTRNALPSPSRSDDDDGARDATISEVRNSNQAFDCILLQKKILLSFLLLCIMVSRSDSVIIFFLSPWPIDTVATYRDVVKSQVFIGFSFARFSRPGFNTESLGLTRKYCDCNIL
jgi:hypothetical protein